MTNHRMHVRSVRLRARALLVILPWLLTGCSLDSPSPREDGPLSERRGDSLQGEHPAGHPGEDHAHDAETSWAEFSLTLEEIAGRTCEHDVPTYQCEECRYEVGVVRVPDALLKGDEGDGPGLLRIQEAATRTVSQDLTLTGEVRWNDNAVAHVSPRVPGVVASVHADVGARVRPGDLLFVLDSVELVRALGDYERTRALTDLSRKNVERETSLYERKISSEQDLIEARMVYEQHNTERKAAEHALRVLGLTREEAASAREAVPAGGAGRLPVRAPKEGTVIERRVVVGQRVEPGSDAMLLADLSTLWVWADIYEPDLLRLLEAEEQGPIPAQVFVRAFPESPFRAVLDTTGAVMDPRSRTVKVRATVENPDHRLRPGMFCEIRAAIPSREAVLAVPRSALLSNGGHDLVFTHWKHDYYVGRPVKTGRAFSDQVEILAGLAPGERVVTEGAFLLKSDVLREKLGAGCAD